MTDVWLTVGGMAGWINDDGALEWMQDQQCEEETCCQAQNEENVGWIARENLCTTCDGLRRVRLRDRVNARHVTRRPGSNDRVELKKVRKR